jgi:hemolysin activation/secretion protein
MQGRAQQRRKGACALLGAGAVLALPAVSSADEVVEIRGRAALEAPSECATAPEGCFMLVGVVIDGARAIAPAALANAYEPYLGQMVSVGDLARIAEAITARYRREGYFLSRAIVPPDSNQGGVARLIVVEGRIAAIKIDGAAREQVEPFLTGVDRDPIADLDALDRRLARASDVPGVTVRSRLEPDPENPALHRLIVSTEFAERSGYAALDNRGTERAGPLQAYGRANANGVFVARDQVSLSAFTTPQSPDEYSYLEGTYAYTFEDGDRVAVSASVSRANNEMGGGAPEAGGDNHGVVVRYERPLVRQRDRGLWLSATFDGRHVEHDWGGGSGYADELRVVRFGLRGFLNESGRSTTYALQTSIGLDVLGASDFSSFNRSRLDADASFVSLTGHLSHYRDFARYFGVYTSVDGQWADAPLLLSEEFYLGGPVYGRAYNSGELTGDRGVAGSVELRAGFDPDWAAVSFVQGYVFADIAEVWNFDTGADSLASAGAGVRVSFDDWLTARWEIARPLTRTPADEGDKDARNFVTLSASY